MKKKILAFLLYFFFLANVAYATHYLLGIDSVDDGEIRWGGSTDYITSWNQAVSTWNALDPIDILPDTIFTWEDLTLHDTYDGTWHSYAGYDIVTGEDLWYNDAYMPDLDADEKQSVSTHELGHDLGLGHSVYGNVMYAYSWDTSLGSQDQDDYHYLWGY